MHSLACKQLRKLSYLSALALKAWCFIALYLLLLSFYLSLYKYNNNKFIYICIVSKVATTSDQRRQKSAHCTYICLQMLRQATAGICTLHFLCWFWLSFFSNRSFFVACFRYKNDNCFIKLFMYVMSVFFRSFDLATHQQTNTQTHTTSKSIINT